MFTDIQFKLLFIAFLFIIGLGFLYKDYLKANCINPKIYLVYNRENTAYIENQNNSYTYIVNFNEEDFYHFYNKVTGEIITFYPEKFKQISHQKFQKISRTSFNSIETILREKTNWLEYRYYIVDYDSLNKKAVISKATPHSIKAIPDTFDMPIRDK